MKTCEDCQHFYKLGHGINGCRERKKVVIKPELEVCFCFAAKKTILSDNDVVNFFRKAGVKI